MFLGDYFLGQKRERGKVGGIKEGATLGLSHEGPLFLENALLVQCVKCWLCKYKGLDLNSQDRHEDRHLHTYS